MLRARHPCLSFPQGICFSFAVACSCSKVPQGFSLGSLKDSPEPGLQPLGYALPLRRNAVVRTRRAQAPRSPATKRATPHVIQTENHLKVENHHPQTTLSYHQSMPGRLRILRPESSAPTRPPLTSFLATTIPKVFHVEQSQSAKLFHVEQSPPANLISRNQPPPRKCSHPPATKARPSTQTPFPPTTVPTRVTLTSAISPGISPEAVNSSS